MSALSCPSFLHRLLTPRNGVVASLRRPCQLWIPSLPCQLSLLPSSSLPSPQVVACHHASRLVFDPQHLASRRLPFRKYKLQFKHFSMSALLRPFVSPSICRRAAVQPIIFTSLSHTGSPRSYSLYDSIICAVVLPRISLEIERCLLTDIMMWTYSLSQDFLDPIVGQLSQRASQSPPPWRCHVAGLKTSKHSGASSGELWLCLIRPFNPQHGVRRGTAMRICIIHAQKSYPYPSTTIKRELSNIFQDFSFELFSSDP